MLELPSTDFRTFLPSSSTNRGFPWLGLWREAVRRLQQEIDPSLTEAAARTVDVTPGNGWQVRVSATQHALNHSFLCDVD